MVDLSDKQRLAMLLDAMEMMLKAFRATVITKNDFYALQLVASAIEKVKLAMKEPC